MIVENWTGCLSENVIGWDVFCACSPHPVGTAVWLLDMKSPFIYRGLSKNKDKERSWSWTYVAGGSTPR